MDVPHTVNADTNDLFLLAINLTKRCNLACAHCYMDAETMRHGDKNELSTEEVGRLLDEIAARSTETMVVLTGGEPLLRGDLEALVAHGAGLGLAMVVGTNGLALTDKRVQALKAAGALGVGISVDSLDPEKHDAFRGLPGAWEKTMNGIEACKRHGLPFQIHFSVTEANADEIPSMIAFARAAGARVLNVFFLVCTGRGESMSDISPVTYERVLNELVAAQEQSRDLLVRARCAPHYKRIAYQRDSASTLTRAAGYEGGGCLAGIHYCRITPEGGVTACPYIPTEEGNIRDKKFWDIWDSSPTFQSLRSPALLGKCGSCEFRKLCGGCRARPFARGESLMDTDPWCVHVPDGSAVIEPLIEQPKNIAWSAEAEKRLARVPSFLRKMVRARAENYVQELGLQAVTEEHLAALAAKRFGAGGPPRPFAGEAAMQQPDGTVEWDADALARVQTAPDFIRAGIRKAAEFNARKEGLARITSDDLTRYRNNAMRRAVRRMKGFGMEELSFAAYEIARERVPRLKDNPEADERFAAIRSFVAARENPGDLLGQELLEEMKAQLKVNGRNGDGQD
jgi:radical SAM protein with 4Fe4S-binding SPASM domain